MQRAHTQESPRMGEAPFAWHRDALGSALRTSDSTASSTRRRHPTAAIVVSILLAAVLLIGAAYYLWRKKRIRGFLISISLNGHYQEESSRRNDLDLPLFDMETIVAATGNFSFGSKLGEGGFGRVYKGILGDEQEITMKRLGKTSIQGLDEFKNEVVLIAKLQHMNLVHLLGCCVEGAERMLIYEYMPNRSLDAFLFETFPGNNHNDVESLKEVIAEAQSQLDKEQEEVEQSISDIVEVQTNLRSRVMLLKGKLVKWVSLYDIIIERSRLSFYLII